MDYCHIAAAGVPVAWHTGTIPDKERTTMERLLEIITDARLVDNPTIKTEKIGVFRLDPEKCPQGIPDCILERFPGAPRIPEQAEVTLYAYWSQNMEDGPAFYELDRVYDSGIGIRDHSTVMLGDLLKDQPEIRKKLYEKAKDSKADGALPGTGYSGKEV